MNHTRSVARFSFRNTLSPFAASHFGGSAGRPALRDRISDGLAAIPHGHLRASPGSLLTVDGNMVFMNCLLCEKEDLTQTSCAARHFLIFDSTLSFVSARLRRYVKVDGSQHLTILKSGFAFSCFSKSNVLLRLRRLRSAASTVIGSPPVGSTDAGELEGVVGDQGRGGVPGPLGEVDGDLVHGSLSETVQKNAVASLALQNVFAGEVKRSNRMPSASVECRQSRSGLVRRVPRGRAAEKRVFRAWTDRSQGARPSARGGGVK